MMTIRKAEFSKVIAALAVVGMIALGFSFAVPQAQALSQSEVDIICTLVGCDASTQAALNALVTGGTTASSFTFTRDLTVGSTGQDVVVLQQFLNDNGFTVAASGAGSAGNETTYFGSLTQSALAQYQAANGITPAVGYFGPITRSSVNSTTTTVADDSDDSDDSSDDSDSSSDLEGGAGSISDVDFISSLNNEEVGEGEEDVEVAGLEIEASKGSDLEIIAVQLDFDYADSGADDELDEYADDVSIWFNGEEIARADASTFEDDDNFIRTVALDSGAIIEAGEEGNLVVALSGVSNLDTSNQGEKWNVSFRSLRYRDAQGSVITESSIGDLDNSADNDTSTDGDERQFSFESFASASNVELQISSDDEDINDAHVIELTKDGNTDEEPILSFTIEVEGSSDVLLKDLPVNLDTVPGGTGNIDDIISAIDLFMDGDDTPVGSQSLSSDTDDDQTVTFDDINLNLEAGQTYSFVVTADINELDGTVVTAGDTIQAQIGSTERGNIDVEDSSGEDLASGDRTGTASSDAHAIYETGIRVSLLEDPTATIEDNQDGATNDTAKFVIKYSVEAFGGDVWVSESSTATETSSPTLAGIEGADVVLFQLDKAGTATAGSGVSAPDSYTTSGENGVSDTGATNGIKIDDGKTATFTLSVTHTNTTSGDAGQYRMSLEGITWEDSAGGADEFLYDFNLDEYQTDYVFVN